jgi:hypothetical protein
MKHVRWILVVLILAQIVVGCAPGPTPLPQVVRETVVVKESVPIKETVVVPQTVVVQAPTSVPPTAAPPAPVTLKVFDPTGAIEVTQLFAPRLSDLNGKTICEVSNTSWEAARTFPVIRELLIKQYPTAKIIDFTRFPSGTTTISDENSKLGDKLKAAGCQAAIVGNAG